MPAGELTLLRLLNKNGQVHACLTYLTHEEILTELHRSSGEHVQWIHFTGVDDDDEPVDCWYERDVICGWLIGKYNKARAVQQRMAQQSGRIHH